MDDLPLLPPRGDTNPPIIGNQLTSIPAQSFRAASICPAALQCLLKYCTARSCCFAFSRVEKVPRLRRLPVLTFFFLEYSRNSPDFSLRIMFHFDACLTGSVAQSRSPGLPISYRHSQTPAVKLRSCAVSETAALGDQQN